MSIRLFKLAFIVTTGLLAWMTISAFRPQRAKELPVGREMEPLPAIASTQPSTASTSESLIPRGESVNKAIEPPPATSSAVKPSTSSPSVSTPAVPESPVAGTIGPTGDHSTHKKQASLFPTPPRKPVDPNSPIRRDGRGTPVLDWDLLGSTTEDDNFKPTFLKKFEVINNQTVSLTGFMHPLDEIGEMGSFLLLEFPIGCFYCITPQPTGLVYIELTAGDRQSLARELVKITGKLQLNKDNPEDFIYSIVDARISLAE